MKKNTMIDERALSQKQKVGSEAASLLFIALLISLVYQQFVLDAPFSQYAAEFFCFFGASLYILVRSLILGNDFYTGKKKNKKWLLISSLVGGCTMGGLLFLQNMDRYGDKHTTGSAVATAAILIFTSTALMFAGFSLLFLLNEKRQARIDRELDQEESLH